MGFNSGFKGLNCRDFITTQKDKETNHSERQNFHTDYVYNYLELIKFEKNKIKLHFI